MKDKHTVVIIDSGAGGLTVAKEIIDRQLNIDIHYLADKAYFPYGVLNDQDLIHRLEWLVEQACQNNSPDVIIIACNTASTLVLSHLRSKWTVPFIGVVPAVKPAAKTSRTRTIGVLATKATVEREYLSRLVSEHATDTKVICYGSQTLVALAEQFIEHGTFDEQQLKHEVFQLLKKDKHIDKLVLACTHFPILKHHIQTLIRDLNIDVIDSTAAIVNRLCTLLPDLETKPIEGQSPGIHFSSTDQRPLTHYDRFIRTGCLSD